MSSAFVHAPLASGPDRISVIGGHGADDGGETVAALLESCGTRVQRVTPESAASHFPAGRVIVAFDVKSDDVSPELRIVADYIRADGPPATVVTDDQNIDTAFALFGDLDVPILVDPDVAELLVAVMTPPRGRNRMRDPAHGSVLGEGSALARISEQLAEVARALGSITASAPPYGGLRETGRDFGGPAAGGGRDIDAATLRDIIRARRMRDRYFDPSLFADPAWDMMLDLLAARLEGRAVSVSSLCIAAAVPSTTALRWIKVMADGGMLVRTNDPNDARRVHIALADATADAMQRYFADCSVIV